jgi:predicted NBD/HSP70 family sugar kinase
VPLGPRLQQTTSLKTVIDNDANALAIYEQWFNKDPVERFGVILIREGVGGSLVLNNQLFDGPVEIGNIVVFPRGRMCRCGNRGCLEVTAGISGITDSIAESTKRTVEGIGAAVKLAEEPGDVGDQAWLAFSAAGIAIARGIGILITIANIDRVVLYGPGVMFEERRPAAKAFLEEVERFREHVSFKAFRDCELVLRPLGGDQGAHGAALIALQRCFGIRPPTPGPLAATDDTGPLPVDSTSAETISEPVK